MIKDAEENAAADEEFRERITAKNGLNKKYFYEKCSKQIVYTL